MAFEPDYIIVGAGASGCVLAARLAQDKNNKVLVVEAGPDNSEDETINNSMGFLFLLDMPEGFGPHPSPSHWGFKTLPQNGKVYSYPRGTGIGGSTNHHALVDGRGSAAIYDRWAEMTGDDYWKYENLTRLFKKMERFDVEGISEEHHGKDGWLNIRRNKPESPFFDDLKETIMEKENVPWRNDFYDDPENFSGLGPCDAQFWEGGQRAWGGKDFFLKVYKENKEKGWNNFEIVTDKLVNRILFEGKKAIGVEAIDFPRAYKVDAAHVKDADNAPKIQYHAKKEVIISGGAINTPQILMLSGIGDKDHLEDFGIEVRQHSPGVGRNLQDHMEVALIYEMDNLPNGVWAWQATMMAEADEKYAKLADPESVDGNIIPFIWDWHSGYDDPDPKDPDIHVHIGQFIFRDFNLNPSKYKTSFIDAVFKQLDPQNPTSDLTFLMEVLKPKANKGTIRLMSDDPTDPPKIDLKLYEDEDAERLALGIQMQRKIMATDKMKEYGPKEIYPGPKYKTVEDLKDYIRKSSSFGHHMCGTCKMGKESDPMAVLDSKMKVRGFENLRVCDASVMPSVPGYNTSRPSYLVGEALAELIAKGH